MNEATRETTGLRVKTDDLLWVPVLTHYADGPELLPDRQRMAAQLASIGEDVHQIMLAGSTGDGWELNDAQFDALIDFAASLDDGAAPGASASRVRVLFGLLRPTTEGVLARLRHLQKRIAADDGLKRRVEGVAVCPPVGADLDQRAIKDHFETVLAEAELPVAVYQLPQVTGCELHPETMAEIARNPKVVMFKDSSGADKVAMSGADFSGTFLVRGAEGGYLEALQPIGPYHGWLLSTGNAFGRHLRKLLRLREAGDEAGAKDLSASISQTVDAVFAAAADEGGANAFSNANRALDHLRAYGTGWRSVPRPLKVDGNRLSEALLTRVASLAGEPLQLAESGYLG